MLPLLILSVLLYPTATHPPHVRPTREPIDVETLIPPPDLSPFFPTVLTIAPAGPTSILPITSQTPALFRTHTLDVSLEFTHSTVALSTIPSDCCDVTSEDPEPIVESIPPSTAGGLNDASVCGPSAYCRVRPVSATTFGNHDASACTPYSTHRARTVSATRPAIYRFLLPIDDNDEDFVDLILLLAVFTLLALELIFPKNTPDGIKYVFIDTVTISQMEAQLLMPGSFVLDYHHQLEELDKTSLPTRSSHTTLLDELDDILIAGFDNMGYTGDGDSLSSTATLVAEEEHLDFEFHALPEHFLSTEDEELDTEMFFDATEHEEHPDPDLNDLISPVIFALAALTAVASLVAIVAEHQAPAIEDVVADEPSSIPEVDIVDVSVSATIKDDEPASIPIIAINTPSTDTTMEASQPTALANNESASIPVVATSDVPIIDTRIITEAPQPNASQETADELAFVPVITIDAPVVDTHTHTEAPQPNTVPALASIVPNFWATSDIRWSDDEGDLEPFGWESNVPTALNTPSTSSISLAEDTTNLKKDAKSQASSSGTSLTNKAELPIIDRLMELLASLTETGSKPSYTPAVPYIPPQRQRYLSTPKPELPASSPTAQVQVDPFLLEDGFQLVTKRPRARRV